MKNKKLWGLLIGSLVIFSLLIIANATDVEARPASAVSLISFDATALDNAVLLEWETGTELSAAGFKIKRGEDNANFNFLADPDSGGDLFIRSEGGPSSGANYEFTDNTAVNNSNYTYILVELDSGGLESEIAEENVTVGVEPTATEIIVGGGNTATSQPTATTRPPTATATTATGNNATATAVPTNTIAPTVTSSAPLSTAIPEASNTPAPIGSGQGDTQATAVPNDNNPTATTVAVEVQEITSDSNVAIAQSQEEAANSAPTDNTEEAVQQADAVQTEANTAIGDASTNDEPADDPVAIGNGANSQPTAIDSNTAPEAQEEGGNSNGRTYLWGGFIVALLVFGVAIAGAILLYTRKRNPGA